MNEEIVVNASPVILLARAGYLDLLRCAGKRILIPRQVVLEVTQRGITDPTTQALQLAEWIIQIDPPEPPRIVIEWDLDPGESAVLAYAVAHPGTVAILDDLAARRCAEVLRVPVMGTLGVAVAARREGRIPRVAPVFQSLLDAGMYVSGELMAQLLALVGE